MKSKLLGLIAGVTLLGVTQAVAAIVDVTYTGIVEASYDMGTFGASGMGFYNGETLVENFVFNTSLGSITFPANETEVSGGPPSNPGVSASAMVNGHTDSVTLGSYSELYGMSQPGNSEYYSYVAIAGAGEMLAYAYASEGSFPNSITTPFTYNAAVANSPGGTITFSDSSTFIQANVETVTVTVVPGFAATPLPAALPLFATGLGAAALFGWRRKRKNARSCFGGQVQLALTAKNYKQRA
jgi:hypothetical protein